jgi:hypothetical protein
VGGLLLNAIAIPGLLVPCGKSTTWPAKVGASLLTWLEAVPGSLLDGSNINVVDGASITKWIDRRDTAGSQSFPYATATASGLNWSAAGKSVTFDGTNYFTLSTPLVVVGTSNGGNSSFYIVGNNEGALVGSTTTHSEIGLQNQVLTTNLIAVADDSSNAANGAGPFSGGLVRVVINHTGVNPEGFGGANIRIACTGGTEYFDTLGADFTLELVGACNDLVRGLIASPAASTIQAIIVTDTDTIADGTDRLIRDYLARKFGASL